MSVIQKKICMLGDFAVGKTSLVRRFVEGRFDDRYLSTIGVTISRKTIVREGVHILNLIIWDLAGGDEWIHTNHGYMRGAAGALLVCDATRPATFKHAALYVGQIRQMNPSAGLVLAVNKSDLDFDAPTLEAQMRQVGAELDIPYGFTSAKTGQGVEGLFHILAASLEKV